jgi:hypothetical protein
MCDTKGVPEDDVGVLEIFVWVGFDPGGDALRGFAGGLGDVAACWVELRVVVYFALTLISASSRTQETYTW